MKPMTVYKKIAILALPAALMVTACKKDDDDSEKKNAAGETVWTGNNANENNNRMHIKNEPIVFDNEGGKRAAGKRSAVGNGTIASTPQTDCTSGCSNSITGNQSGNLNINNGQHICITSGASFSGNVNINGGTLSVCGTASLSNLNLNNGGMVILNSGAVLALSSPLNINASSSFVNYSKAGVNISGGVNNNGVLENYGIMDVSGNFNVNGNAELINTCRINTAGDFHQNGDFDLFGYMNINGTVFFNNPTGANDLNSGALITCNNIFVNTTLNGVGSDYAKIDVSGTTTINGSGNLQGLIDLCDANGIEVNNGTVASSVTHCQAYIQAEGNCKPSSGTEPETEFVLVADVEAPKTPGGAKLSATSIQIIGNYGYVSWHLNEGPEDYAGLLEVYDMNNPESPSIISTLWSTDIDFNHVYVDPQGSSAERKFWVVGSRNIYTGNLNSPGFLGEFTLTNEIFTNETFVQTDLPSFSGNCVVEKNNELILVSGNTGGALSKLDLNAGILNTVINEDGLKYLDFDGNKLILLKQGNPSSELLVYNLPNPDFNAPVLSVPVGPITPVDGKNVAHINGNKAFVATGNQGMKIFDIITGSSTPIHTYNSNLPGAVNGVSTDNDYIYIANGSSGLHILKRDDNSLLGNYSYNGSANFTASKNNYILVANGIGGIKIIRRDNSN